MVKLNVHLAVDERTVQFCRLVNAGIRNIADSSIVFDDHSPMIPHVTLAMGELSASKTLEGLILATKTLAYGAQSLTLNLGRPYIGNLMGRYVLCDVEENPKLTELRKVFLDSLLISYLIAPDMYSEIPHLTLANIEAQQDQVRTYLATIKSLPQILCTQIEISHVGPKGTCIDRLFAIDLVKKPG